MTNAVVLSLQIEIPSPTIKSLSLSSQAEAFSPPGMAEPTLSHSPRFFIPRGSVEFEA